ncbi:MAG: nucleoside deaminase [Verrucomicrobia bacterium]|nr:nucleoside deaminase [Verrucomicrobiota bacterium]
MTRIDTNDCQTLERGFLFVHPAVEEQKLLKLAAPMAKDVSFASTTTDENYIADLARFTERTFLTDSPVPFGAMVLNTETGERLIRTVNNSRKENDATCHAEVRAIRLAGKRIKRPILKGYTLFSTCEPCPMCMAAILWARLDRVVFGATIEDASWHCHQIHIKATDVVAKSDMKCVVTGPVARDRCYELFTAPVMTKTFEYWRNNRT